MKTSFARIFNLPILIFNRGRCDCKEFQNFESFVDYCDNEIILMVDRLLILCIHKETKAIQSIDSHIQK